MARMQVYGKVGRKQVRTIFAFDTGSDKGKDKPAEARDAAVIEQGIQRLSIKEANFADRAHDQTKIETALLPKDANAAVRRRRPLRQQDDWPQIEKNAKSNLVGQWEDPSDSDNLLRVGDHSIKEKQTVNKEALQTEKNETNSPNHLKTPQDSQEQNAPSSQCYPNSKSVDAQKLHSGEISLYPQRDRSAHFESPSEGISRHSTNRSKMPPIRTGKGASSRTRSPASVPRKKAPAAPAETVPEYVKVLLPQAEEDPIPFTKFGRAFSDWYLSKVAEAGYSECYRLTRHSSTNPQIIPPRASEIPGQKAVLKVIPLKPPTRTKAEKARAPKSTSHMSLPSTVLSEIEVLRLLSDVPGFTNFLSLHLVYGPPSKNFIDAYHAHRARRSAALHERGYGNQTINDEFQFPVPDSGRNGSWYRKDQWWAIIEMEDAGSDLEHLDIGDVFAVWDVFWSTTVAVGKGESVYGFEHRDLHPGNVCVSLPAQKPMLEADNTERLEVLKAPTDIDIRKKLGFTNATITVIDYTNSRAMKTSVSSRGGKLVFKDLDKELDLFVANADSEYQYEIPRYMRDCLLKEQSKRRKIRKSIILSDDEEEPEETPKLSSKKKTKKEMTAVGVDWSKSHPRTNVIWLHFLLRKLLEWSEQGRDDMRERLKFGLGKGPSKRGSPHRPANPKGSRKDAAVLDRAAELEAHLQTVADWIEPQALFASGLTCAGDLVHRAYLAGWLGEDDING
ncbi:MAG: hypothetical protein M1820_008969 [Bogoriella megaspora]|nr:MAG: hypothetical protein M1820_008969 [Bogoriella megaspora]